MNQRRKRTPQRSDTKDQQISELQEQLSQALEIIQKQQKQIERLEQRLQQQQEELEYLKRIGKRQATPFARRHWVEKPKRPGRKAGKGRFAHRELPNVGKIHETKEVKLHGCPACGSRLEAIRKQEQFVTDIPVVEVQTTRFVTYSGYCTACHKRVRSQHPEQTLLATGTAGVMVGPRAKALAADLKHRLGVSYGKVSEVLNDAFGLQVSRSGWCQADQKLARTARPVYEELLEVIRQCSVVNADETGWRIGTLSAWLWVFTQREVTVYTIRANRSSDVMLDVLGTHFSGVLTSDGHLAYDDRRLSDWLKQQCLSHLLRDLKDMNETKTGRALQFARQATSLLQEALALKREKPTLPSRTFSHQARALEARLDLLIATMPALPSVCASIDRISCASCMWMTWKLPTTWPSGCCDQQSSLAKPMAATVPRMEPSPFRSWTTLSNFSSSARPRLPSFNAKQVRYPSLQTWKCHACSCRGHFYFGKQVTF